MYIYIYVFIVHCAWLPFANTTSVLYIFFNIDMYAFKYVYIYVYVYITSESYLKKNVFGVFSLLLQFPQEYVFFFIFIMFM
jgi:hypothetical protein